MDIICGQWVVGIIQLLPRSRALTGWATAKYGRRGKTWLFLFSLSFPSSVHILPFSTVKAKFGYSPHSHSQTDHLVAELLVETVRKMGSLSRPASTQISPSEMVFSAFSWGFNSVVHIRITCGHMHSHWKSTSAVLLLETGFTWHSVNREQMAWEVLLPRARWELLGFNGFRRTPPWQMILCPRAHPFPYLSFFCVHQRLVSSH